MKRKRFLLRMTLLLSVMLFALGGCGKSEKAEVKTISDFAPLGEIGKTFDLIREENPNIEYQTVAIPDASGECLGQARDSFFYFFFGTQDFPGLMDLSAEYGGQLKCAGIVSTVGEVYPETAEELPLEQFFSDRHISEYTYHLEEDPAQGWLEFSHDGYLVWIDTNTGGTDSDGGGGAAAMDPGWTILIMDEEIAGENYAIWDTYWESYLESNLPK